MPSKSERIKAAEYKRRNDCITMVALAMLAATVIAHHVSELLR